MSSRSRVVVAAWGMSLAAVAACGSSANVDFFDTSTSSSAAGAAPVSDHAGTAGAPVAQGGSGSGGSEAGGRAGASADPPDPEQGGRASVPDDTPCSPVIEASGKMTGPFNTSGPYCLRVTDEINGWGCSNFAGRTVKVNGVAVTCAQIPLPDKIRGAYIFDVSAGDLAYASLYWFL